MCFSSLFGGSQPADNSGEIARQQEAARQARINAGRASIDETFSGFNDDYYNQYRDAYTANYEPQLEDQYRRAYERATLGLAGSGNLNSSAGAGVLADLTRELARQRTQVANNAQSAVNDLRGRVEQSRQSLYDQNRASADPSATATLAGAQAESLRAPQTFSPLGNVFADLLNNAGTVLSLEARSYPGLRTGLFNNRTTPAYSTQGSGYNVG